MLRYMCMDKIINVTAGIKNSSQDTLDWLLDHWCCINLLSEIDQTYCFKAICRKRTNFDVSMSLCTLNPLLYLSVYEMDEVLYVDMKREVFNKLLENKYVRSHLASGINRLKFCRYRIRENTKDLDNKEERLNLKTFLSYCRSVKYVDRGEIFPHHKKITFAVLESLSDCSQIESIHGFINSVGCYSKYLLGINWSDISHVGILAKKVHKATTHSKDRAEHLQLFIKEINRIIDSSKPLWPNLISVHNLCNEIPILFGLSIFILKELRYIRWKDFSIEASKSIFFQDDVFNNFTKSLLVNRIETVTMKEVDFCFKNNLLSKEVNLLIDFFNVNKDLEQINQFFTDNPSLYDLLSFLLIDFYTNSFSFIEMMISLVSNSPNLKMIELYPYDFDNDIVDYGPSTVCSLVVQNLVIDYRLCRYYHFNYVNRCLFKNFPFVKNLNLVIRDNTLNETYYNSSLIEALPDLACLENVNVLIDYANIVENDLITFMVNLSKIVENHTKLTYSIEVNKNARIHFILRLNGWVSKYRVFTVC